MHYYQGTAETKLFGSQHLQKLLSFTKHHGRARAVSPAVALVDLAREIKTNCHFSIRMKKKKTKGGGKVRAQCAKD